MTTLDNLKRKQEKLRERIKTLEAKQASRARKDDTRRKVLLGSLVMDWMQKDHELKARVDKALPIWLKRDVDRTLFGLPPLPESKRSVPASGSESDTVVTSRPAR